MEQETRGCVSRVTRVPGGKYPTPAIPGPLRNAIPRAQYGMQYQAQGSTAAPGHGTSSALRAARLRLRSSRLRRRRDAPADRVMTRRGAARAAGPRYRRRASVRYGARRVGRAFHPGNCLRFHTTASQLKLSNLSMLTQSSASPHTSLAPPKRSLNYRMRRCWAWGAP
jgi:hypothetical protein